MKLVMLVLVNNDLNSQLNVTLINVAYLMVDPRHLIELAKILDYVMYQMQLSQDTFENKIL